MTHYSSDEPLYSCGKIGIRLLCAAALTIVLQKSTLPDRLNSQPPSFRMKWQMLSMPSPHRLGFEDVFIPGEVRFPTRSDGRPVGILGRDLLLLTCSWASFQRHNSAKSCAQMFVRKLH
jgi:hypothetical protein